MRTYEERRKLRRSLYSKPVLLVLLLLLVVFTRAVWQGYKGSQLANDNLQMASLEKKEIEARIKVLETDLNNLNTERGLEESIRSKFGVAKADEGVIILVDENSPDSAESSKEASFWGKFFDFFKRN